MNPAPHALRVLHLDLAIRRWLGGGGAVPVDRMLGAHVSRWLSEAGDGPLFERLPTLVAELQQSFPGTRERTAADFDTAFANVLVEQAFADVAREATRSGRADVFVSLKPHLQANPAGAELDTLAQALSMPPQAVELALAGMRRRLRGRIEAALDLWSGSPESRDTLRRHMRAALREGNP